MSDREVVDLSKFRETLKEAKDMMYQDEEEEMELFIPLSLIKELIMLGYDPTSLKDIERYVLQHGDTSTATYYGPLKLRHDNDG